MFTKHTNIKSLVILGLVCGITALTTSQASNAFAATTSDITKAEKHNRAGVEYYKAGNLSDAIHQTLLAYELVPDSRLIFNIARIYHKMSEYQLAVQHYEKYILSSDADLALVKKAQEYKVQALKVVSNGKRTTPPSTSESLFLLSDLASASPKNKKRTKTNPGLILRLTPLVEVEESATSTKRFKELKSALRVVIDRHPDLLALSPASNSHIRLISYKHRLIFMPMDASWPKALEASDLNNFINTHFLSIDTTGYTTDSLVERLDDTLWRVSKAHRLLEITEAMNSRPTLVGTVIEKGSKNSTQLLSVTRESKLQHGDRLSVRVSNLSKNASDITVLYIDSHYGITTVFPSSENPAEARIKPGSKKIVYDGNVDTSETKGREHLIVIAAPVQAGESVRTFTMLEQESPSQTRGAAQAASPGNDLLAFLTNSERTGTRGMSRNNRPSTASPAISVYTWKTTD